MTVVLPRTVQLPTLRVVQLEAKKVSRPRKARPGEPLYSEAIDLFESGDLAMRADGAPVTVYDLDLADFHALRAIATCAGLLAEEEIIIHCRNCDGPITTSPCKALPLGPFVDRELSDPELDATLDLTLSHEIPVVRLGRGGAAREATSVILSPLTVENALPLFAALAKPELVVKSEIVRAMGIAELGPEKNPARIARALAAASETAWRAITDLYLLAHYPPRLFSIALCPGCGARNDVDAPYDREFVPGETKPASPDPEIPELPGFEPFAEYARSVAQEIFDRERVELTFIVEGGVPAVDDGGEPLMGAYVPGSPGEMTTPSRPHEITLYYRTFRAIWDEDGAFDWKHEIEETILHELEHHLAYLAGDDPMDEEEHAEIEGEALRVLGKRAVVRESVRSLGDEIADFLRRTWLIWLVLAIATAVVSMGR
jgi:hypothetical protein